jgi:hypothetical protein
VIRVAAIGRKVFRAGGLTVTDKFTALTGEAAQVREFLRKYVGRWVRLHPDDAAKLGKLGLRLEDGQVVEAKADKVPPPAPPAKGDKKEGAPART